MAIVTIGAVGADYTTINAAILGTTFPGNVLELQADFVHDNTRVTFNKSDIVLTSYSGNPRDPGCTVTSTDQYTIMEQGSAGNSHVSGITVETTRGSGTRYAFYMNLQKVTLSNCVVRSNHRGVAYPGTDTIIQRCHFESSVADGNTAIFGTSGTPDNWSVDSCFFSNWKAAFYTYKSRPTVRNCTFYSPNNGSANDLVNWRYQGSTHYPEEAKMYNCIIYSSSGTDTMYSGIRMGNVAGTANVVQNVIAFGDYSVSSFRFDGEPPINVTTSDLFDSVPGTNTPTLPVFVAIGTDFHPDPAGSAYQAGDPAHTPAYDIEGNPFDPTNPSIGCYEGASSGGGGGGGAVSNSRAGFLPSPFTLTP